MTKQEAHVTAEDRVEIERWIAKGCTSGRLDCDEVEDMKCISWELLPDGSIKIIDVWYA